MKWLREIEDRWDTKTGLALVVVIVAAALIWSFTNVDLRVIRLWQWAVLAIVISGLVLSWRATRLQRVTRGKIGFGLAIEYEDNAAAIQVRNDFAQRLRDLIQGSNELSHRFEFVEFNRRITRRLLEDENRTQLARRLRCHFVLYGRAKQRTFADGVAYVIELGGIVLHAEVEQTVKRQLAEDFSRVLPGMLKIANPDSILALAFAAAHVDVVARYIIGTAAGLSGDFRYAEEVLTDAKRRLDIVSAKGSGAPLAVLRQRIPQRLVELYDHILTLATQRYTWKRDLNALRDAEDIILRRRQCADDSYQVRQCVAMCAFLLRRDLQEAYAQLTACRNIDDASWRYGKAFLLAYEWDLDRAYRSYMDAFAAPLDEPTVPIQCEEFIHGVLEEEPTRYGLYFCLGIINHRAKGDLLAAKHDFEEFQRRLEQGKFKPQRDAVITWLAEIEALLGAQHAAESVGAARELIL